MDVVVTLLLGILPGLASVYLYDKCPWVARWVVRRTASFLPSAIAERWEEEWLADLSDQDTKIDMLLCALGCVRAVRKIEGFKWSLSEAIVEKLFFRSLLRQAKRLLNMIKRQDFGKVGPDFCLESADLLQNMALQVQVEIERTSRWHTLRKIRCVAAYIDKLKHHPADLLRMAGDMRSMGEKVREAEALTGELESKKAESKAKWDKRLLELDQRIYDTNAMERIPGLKERRAELQVLVDRLSSL